MLADERDRLVEVQPALIREDVARSRMTRSCARSPTRGGTTPGASRVHRRWRACRPEASRISGDDRHSDHSVRPECHARRAGAVSAGRCRTSSRPAPHGSGVLRFSNQSSSWRRLRSGDRSDDRTASFGRTVPLERATATLDWARSSSRCILRRTRRVPADRPPWASHRRMVLGSIPSVRPAASAPATRPMATASLRCPVE